MHLLSTIDGQESSKNDGLAEGLVTVPAAIIVLMHTQSTL